MGRDPETAATLPQPDVPGLDELTADARSYGFHATLKPPMRLATAYDLVLADVHRIARSIAPFALPPLHVADLSGFLALRETAPCPPLQALSDAFVAGLDRHRAPPDEAELARRRKGGLSPEREAMLLRWGYPHVFETWFFHMTLTRRLTVPERASVQPAATRHFTAALAAPRMVQSACIFTQAGAGAPFLLAERVPLGG